MTAQPKSLAMSRVLFIFVIFMAPWAWAVDTSVSNAFWLTGFQQAVRDSAGNSSNQLLKIPETSGRFDWRPEFKLNDGSAQFVVRPLWTVTAQKVTAGNLTENSTTYKWQWLDAFMTIQGKGDIAMTYGVQNFQWGPAEAASPSNPIFRESVQEKDLLFTTIGRHILRFNISPAQSWNFIAMAELSEGGATQPIAEETFRPQGLVKSEYSWSGGAKYLGLIFGGRQSGELSIGEYGSFELVDDLSVYFDGGHQRGSRSWYPIKDATTGLITFSQDRLKSDQLMSFLVLGTRYNFQRGTDLRFELIWQESGYSSEQRANAWQALTTQSLPQLALLPTNSARFSRNGQEFPGQQYALLSVREPNFWSFKDWSLYLRVLTALKDKSSSIYLASESAIGDHGTLYASGGAGAGADDSELRGFTNWNFLAGVRLNW